MKIVLKRSTQIGDSELSEPKKLKEKNESEFSFKWLTVHKYFPLLSLRILWKWQNYSEIGENGNDTILRRMPSKSKKHRVFLEDIKLME